MNAPAGRTDTDVLVLGAGVVGVSTAYFLMRAGLSVTVVERLPGAALDTSFANGGQISVSHAEPWANPEAPLQVLRWLLRDSSPLLFRPRLDPAQWSWMARWLRECLPGRTRENTRQLIALATESRDTLRDIRAEEGFAYDEKTLGILHLYRDPAAFAAAQRIGHLLNDAGVAHRVVSRDEMLALEPALDSVIGQVLGGTHTPDDESGDAHLFTRRLAEVCARKGARFLYNREITTLVRDGRSDRIAGVETRDLASGCYERLPARAVVVALGVQSVPLVAPLGIRLPIYPAKGYSVTIPVGSSNAAPQISITDDEHKIVFSRLGDRLRVAGTAELSGYSRTLNMVRCNAILDQARATFPGAGDFEAAQFWTGLRPATPSNVPMLGRSRLANLYLNTGHGTLGWTLGPGSGKRVAQDVADDLARGG